VEAQVGELLERGILTANSIDAGNKLTKVIRMAPVASLDLVFFGMVVFLGAGIASFSQSSYPL
jgi:hypothetical protein